MMMKLIMAVLTTLLLLASVVRGTGTYKPKICFGHCSRKECRDDARSRPRDRFNGCGYKCSQCSAAWTECYDRETRTKQFTRHTEYGFYNRVTAAIRSAFGDNIPDLVMELIFGNYPLVAGFLPFPCENCMGTGNMEFMEDEAMKQSIMEYNTKNPNRKRVRFNDDDLYDTVVNERFWKYHHAQDEKKLMQRARSTNLNAKKRAEERREKKAKLETVRMQAEAQKKIDKEEKRRKKKAYFKRMKDERKAKEKLEAQRILAETQEKIEKEVKRSEARAKRKSKSIAENPTMNRSISFELKTDAEVMSMSINKLRKYLKKVAAKAGKDSATVGFGTKGRLQDKVILWLNEIRDRDIGTQTEVLKQSETIPDQRV